MSEDPATYSHGLNLVGYLGALQQDAATYNTSTSMYGFDISHPFGDHAVRL